MKTSAKTTGRRKPAGQREGPAVDVDKIAVGQKVKTRSGAWVTKTADNDVCPSRWNDAFLVYPRGSVIVQDHPLEYMSDEQWAMAVRMLGDGYVLGFDCSDAEAPDAMCAVQRNCPFALTAVKEPNGNDIVFVARRDWARALKGEKGGKRRETLEVH
jgi:hypothetical protein